MGQFNCFCSSWRKKKNKGMQRPVTLVDKNDLKILNAKLENLQGPSEATELRSSSFILPVPFNIPGSCRCKVKVMNYESPVAADSGGTDYEGGDELDESPSIKRDGFGFELKARVEKLNKDNHQKVEGINNSSSLGLDGRNRHTKMRNVNGEEDLELTSDGHLSDLGMEKSKSSSFPELKRTCSNLVMRNMSKELAEKLPSPKSKSCAERKRLAKIYAKEVLGAPTSPISDTTHYSADKVILKKYSSSQILPSRSRRLWWKLFLWSHRNLHKAEKPQPTDVRNSSFNPQGGYYSDTVEAVQAVKSNKLRSSVLLARELTEKGKCNLDDQSHDGCYEASVMWPQNQWVAFPAEPSSFTRVEEWVQEVSAQYPSQTDTNDHSEDDGFLPPQSPDNGASPGRDASHLTQHVSMNIPEEIAHANSVIQSLNATSTVAHITGIGLKVIPSISHFASLRSVNLSGNFIVHITSGSLPKGLHLLDLSRNKISTIEGLRDLTRLRVLDLSYNRISRIGQGLSNCTVIKELYLAGNKVSNVEGLHRLLKLTILDLSFNKITTTKALGQLVANYSSLIALNLLGNPIQSNISDDQLRKTVCGLLPKLAFLNKQSINPQKAREICSNSIAKAALGINSRNTRKKAVKRVSQGSSSVLVVRRSNSSSDVISRQRSRGNSHQHVVGKEKTQHYLLTNSSSCRSQLS